MTATAPEAAADSVSWGSGLTAATLEDCLHAAAAGRLEPFGRLFDLTASRVYGIVLQVLRNREWAEEVTREVYLSVWRQAADFTPVRSSGIGWVLMIAHRRAVDQVRRHPAGYHRDTAHAGTAVPRVDDQIAAPAESAFARLTESQRRLINFAYFQGRTHTEICSDLDLPPGGAAAGIRNSLARLRDVLEA